MPPLIVVKIRPKNIRPSLSAPIIVVSKKAAKKAVERNLLKRRIKAIISAANQKKEKNLMIITKAGAEKLSFQELKQEIASQLKNYP